MEGAHWRPKPDSELDSANAQPERRRMVDRPVIDAPKLQMGRRTAFKRAKPMERNSMPIKCCEMSESVRANIRVKYDCNITVIKSSEPLR